MPTTFKGTSSYGLRNSKAGLGKQKALPAHQRSLSGPASTATSTTPTRQNLHTPTPSGVNRSNTQSTPTLETPPEDEEEESHPPAAQRPLLASISSSEGPSSSIIKETPTPNGTHGIQGTQETQRTQETQETIIPETLTDYQQTDLCYLHESTPGGIIQLTKEVIAIIRSQNTKGQPLQAKQLALQKLDDIVLHLEEHEVDYERQLKEARATHNYIQLNSEGIGIIQAMHDKITNLEKELGEIKQTLAKGASDKTLAEIVSRGPEQVAPAIEKPQRKLRYRKLSPEKEEELKQHRQKLAIMLSTAKADTNTKKYLKEKHPKEIINIFQKAVDDVYKDSQNPPQLVGMNKLPDGAIRLHCRDEESAQMLQFMDWTKAFPGIEKHRSKYGIVVHMVSKLDINPSDTETYKDQVEQLEDENTRSNLRVAQIVPLRRRPKRNQTSIHHSIVIFTYSAKEADECINLGVIINGEQYSAQRYTPQLNITQCYKCYAFGHRATQCRGPGRCGKCGSTEHETTECTEEVRCCNCQGAHPAWHIECPKRDEEAQRLDQLRIDTSRFFTR